MNKEVGRREVLNSYHGMGQALHCMKSFQIRSFFWSVFSRIQSECGKNGPEKTPYLDTFHTSLKWDQMLCGGMTPLDFIFIDCTLLSFKMQVIFPGLEYIGYLSIYLSFNQIPDILFIFSL